MGCCTSCSIEVFAKNVNTFHSQYILGENIGHGSYGDVLACEHVESSEQFAVKVLDVGSNWNFTSSYMCRISDRFSGIARARKRAALEEAHMMRIIGHHKHCVRLHEVFISDSACLLVMERCEKSAVTALEEMMILHPVEDNVQGIIYDVLLALRHIHALGIVHRDVKPENMLLCGQDSMVTKLADFGFAVKIPANGYLIGMVGSAPYMSPEMVNHIRYDTKTDMWSLGASAYVMLYGRFPYESKKKGPMIAKIATGTPPPCYRSVDGFRQPSSFSESVVRSFLVRHTLVRDSASRALEQAYGKELERVAVSRYEISGGNCGASLLPDTLAADKAMSPYPSTNVPGSSDDDVIDLMYESEDCQRASAFLPIPSLSNAGNEGSVRTRRWTYWSSCSKSPKECPVLPNLHTTDDQRDVSKDTSSPVRELSDLLRVHERSSHFLAKRNLDLSFPSSPLPNLLHSPLSGFSKRSNLLE